MSITRTGLAAAATGLRTVAQQIRVSNLASGTPTDSSDSVNCLSYLAGAEMPIAVARHVSVSPYGRLYLLRGLPRQPTDPASWNTGIGAGMTVAFRW